MTAAVGRATGADARLPDASAILPLAARENFPVASLLVGRKTRAHLLAIYGFARLVDQLGDEVDGDRLALLDALERGSRTASSTASREHPLLRRLRADGARVLAPARAVPAPDRGEPPRPGAVDVRDVRRARSTTATSRRIRSASSCCTSSARRRRSGSRSRTASARRSSSSSTGRTSARTSAAGASTSRREDLRALRRRAGRPRRRALPGAALRELLAFEVERARAAARRGRAARRHAARPRAHRGRRLRRRRPRDPRRDRARRLRRARAARRGRRRAAAGAPLARDAPPAAHERRAPAYAECRRHRARVGLELLRRHAPAAARPARRDLRHLRARAPDRRHRRRRARRPRTSSTRSATSATSSTRLARDATTPCSSRSPTRRAATRSRSTRSATSSTAPRWTCAATTTRRSPTRSSTAAASRARSAGSRSASSRRPTATRAEQLADDLGVALQLDEHPPRPRARTSANGRVYLPREDLDALRLQRRPTAASTARPSCSSRSRRSARSSRLERGLDARAAARPAQRRVRARDGRRVPPAARADRAASRARPARAAVAPALGEGPRARAQPRAERGVNGAPRRGRRRRPRGDRGRARPAPTHGASVTLFEARTRLGGATFSVQRNGPLDRQRPARRCSAAAPRTAASSQRLGVEHLVPIQPRLRVPMLREGKPPAFLRRAPLPAPLHLVPTLAPLRAARAAASALHALRAAAALRDARSRRTPRSTSRTFGDWLRAHGQSDARDRGALEPDRAADAEPAGGRGVARARDDGLPHRPARRGRRRATSASRGAAAAAARRRGRRPRSSAPACTVALGAAVKSADGRRVVLEDGAHEADAVVVAVPHDAVA